MTDATYAAPPVDQYTKLDVPHKVGYALGDFACNMSWSLVSGYLVFFMTDIALIPAALVSAVMLISKAWDAINDPIVGTLADHTKSRLGRYRPWILFASVPMLVCNVLAFTTFPNWGLVGRSLWAFGTYFVLVLLYTMVNVTYSAMPAVMTRDANTRTSLASYRMTAAFLAMTLLSYFLLRVVEWTGGGAHGYQMAALIFSALACPFFFIVFASTKEVVDVKPERSKFSTSLKAMIHNTPMWHIVIAYLGWGVVQGGFTVKVYYCTYNIGDQILYANASTLQSIVGMLGTFSVTFLVKKVKNKGTLAGIGSVLIALGSIVCYFAPASAVGGTIYLGMAAPIGFGMGMMLASIFGMQPDCAEYTQYYEHGVYIPGFISTIINFALKFGQAVAISAATAVMAALGYVANTVQTPRVLSGINFMSHMFVFLVMVLVAISMFTYKLDKEKYAWLCEKVSKGESAAEGEKPIC